MYFVQYIKEDGAIWHNGGEYTSLDYAIDTYKNIVSYEEKRILEIDIFAEGFTEHNIIWQTTMCDDMIKEI